MSEGPRPVGKREAMFLALVVIRLRAIVHLNTRCVPTEYQGTFRYKVYSIQNMLTLVIVQKRVISHEIKGIQYT